MPQEKPWTKAIDLLKSAEDDEGKKLYSDLVLYATTYMYAWVRRSVEVSGQHGNITGDLENWADKHYKALDEAIGNANAYLLHGQMMDFDSQDILVLPRNRESVKDMARELMDILDEPAKGLVHYLASDLAKIPEKP